MSDSSAGMLVLAATPIGNAADASLRLRELIETADLIAAEDTRKFRDLARRLDVTVSAKVISHHEHNESARTGDLLDAVAAGQLVLVVSDAGMPTISDPGYPLIAAATSRDLPVTVAPGPSAVLTALAISGLATDRFTFEGFIPRKTGEKRRTFEAVATDPRTLVFFESPHRVRETLTVMGEVFGDERSVAACRELTKTYEEVLRGSISDVLEQLPETPRGEFVIVVAGAQQQAVKSVAELVGNVIELTDHGARLKEAVAQVAAGHGVSKRELYEAVLATR
ncbi:16S rRNA (cytidine1402-2'-O)-methyltransferase [Micrococcales bacterium KH10]|nr:16S rRNA (cytidine1402-2'-O)-methyltransferase [Micrococcales bacterium KH10]